VAVSVPLEQRQSALAEAADSKDTPNEALRAAARWIFLQCSVARALSFGNRKWSRGESNPRPLECDPILARQEPPTTDHNCREKRAMRRRRFGACGELWDGEPVEKP